MCQYSIGVLCQFTSGSDTEHILNVLGRLNASPTPASVETSLHLKEAPLANTSRYDRLRGSDDVVADAAEVNPA